MYLELKKKSLQEKEHLSRIFKAVEGEVEAGGWEKWGGVGGSYRAEGIALM